MPRKKKDKRKEPKKTKPTKPELDTETSFADMNVEGMPGYDPSKKKTGDMKTLRKPVDRKEYWRMVRGAYAAVLPILLIILLVGVALFAIAWLWLS